MSKNYIYLIITIAIFLSGLFVGHGSVEGEIDIIADNLQSAESRVSELESSISRYKDSVSKLKELNARSSRIIEEQTIFIDTITAGFDYSRESVDSIERGADRGAEIIEGLLKEIGS